MEDSHASSPAIVYTLEQLRRYLAHIRYPNSAVPPPPTLQTLQKLMPHHQSTAPFENLTIHYSRHHKVLLDPAHLYKKVVEKGRGGYCMEMNGMFSVVLRSLGFEIYTTGARVDWSGSFTGWSHMVIIVTIEGQRYLVDVAYGTNSSGPISALPLTPNSPVPATGSQLHRLLHKPLKQLSNRGLPQWIFQCQNTPQEPWLDEYAFSTEIEFFQEDYEVMSYAASTLPTSIFQQMVFCIRTILSSELTTNEEFKNAGISRDGEVRAVGKVILKDREVRRRVGARTEKVDEFASEAERWEGLRKWFGIVLDEEEKRGIRGLKTEIKTYEEEEGTKDQV
ncbi:hypothetical protein RUND412_008208 [Rhizina undulata]